MTDKAEKKNLEQIVGRVKALMAEIADLQEQVREEMKDAKAAGYNTSILRRVVKEMTLDPEKYDKQLELELELDTYRENVGLRTGMRWAEARIEMAAADERREVEAHKRLLERAAKVEADRDAAKLAAADALAAEKVDEPARRKKAAARIADKYFAEDDAPAETGKMAAAGA